jgi:phosphocarrier protein HPr
MRARRQNSSSWRKILPPIKLRVSARSIMGLMMLAATRGTSLKICAVGADASEAVGALMELIDRKFDEE